MSTIGPMWPTALHGAHLRRDVVAQAGRHRLAAAIADRAVTPLWAGVVVETSLLLDPRTRAAAAQLTAGPRAVLSGTTAAFLHGCRSAAGHETHLHVPYGCAVRGRRGLIVHQGRWPDEDVRVLDGLRLLALDRVVADLLCTLPWRGRSRDALAILDEALRHAGETSETFRKDVGERLARRHDPRGTRYAALLLDVGSGRVESPAESWMRMALIEAGVPIPEVNWQILTPDGRELHRLDMAWPGQRICLEYDGWESHAGREDADEARAAELRRHGWIVVRAKGEDLSDPARLIGELRAAFARRGYTW